MDFIFIADLHIGRTGQSVTIDQWTSPYWGGDYKNVSSRMIEVMNRLGHTGRRAMDLGIGTIIVGGDVFDSSRPKNHEEAMFLHWIRWCHERDIQVVIFAGNHDFGLDWTSLVSIEAANWDNLWVPNDLAVITEDDEPGVLVVPHFSDYAWRRRYGEKTLEQVIAEFMEDKGPVDVIATHAHARQLTYSSEIFFEASEAMTIDIEDLDAMGYKGPIYSGHIHSHRTLSTSGGTYLVYPGSIAVNKFDEVDDEKGMIIVQGDEDRFEEYPEEEYPYLQLDIDLVSKDTIQWDEDTLEGLRGHLMKVVVDTNDPLKVDRNNITATLNKYGYVVKFELRMDRKKGKIEGVGDEEVISNINHEDLLSEWVETYTGIGKDTKDRVMTRGKEIISEVLGD